jgi:TatD DNase family protein
VDYFDTHCHLNHSAFAEDLDDVVKRASDSGVKHILVPGWNLESSIHAVELAEKYEPIIAAVGIHPSDWQTLNNSTIVEIRKLSEHPKVAAIGEIGLDYYHDQDHRSEQQHLLQAMLEIAGETKKIVLLHSRESMDDIKALIINWMKELIRTNNPLSKKPGIFHAFEGNLEDANELIPFGFKFAVGGPLTYKNSHLKASVFGSLPETFICLETDSPYLPPSGHRGERNEPAYLPQIADKLVELRVQKCSGFLNQIFENSYKMFLEDVAH